MSLAIIRAAGSPREMGRAHGSGMAGAIAAALDFYEELEGERWHRGLSALGPYIDVARTSLPELVDEIGGIAEASDRDFEEIALLNCIEEVYEVEACTTLATDRFLMHAEQWYAGHGQVGAVVAEPSGGPAFVSPTCAGCLPAVGMNASGFAQGIDSLFTLDDQVGIPRVLVSSHALRARDMTSAMSAASVSPRAGGYAHVLASHHDSVVIETSAQAVRALEGEYAHTNHCLASEIPAKPGSNGSEARLERARGLLSENPPTTVPAAIAILADHEGAPQAICNHSNDPSDTTTVFGMVCDLRDGITYVSDGPPCEAAWRELKVPGFLGSEAGRVG